MFTKYLPTFKYMEVNDLVGLRSGHMLSQIPADAAITKVSKGDAKFIENGLIVGLSATGTVENFDKSKHPVMFVHFTEELNTVVDELKYFALEAPDGEKAYPRCVALYVGDTFTTTNYDGTLNTAKYAKVVAGVPTLQTAADDDTAFIATPSDMPNGDEAVELTFYRMPTTTTTVGP